jgi:hypothetical protein
MKCMEFDAKVYTDEHLVVNLSESIWVLELLMKVY